MARKEQMLAGIDYDGSIIVGTEKNDYINKPCTVVIHEGKPERVFTESEVRAMLEDMRNDPLTDELQRSGVIEPIAAKHGIVLDPA